MVSFFYKKTTLKFRFLLFLFKKMKQKLLQVILGITLLCFLFTNLETHASNQRANRSQTFSFAKFDQTLESLKSTNNQNRLSAQMRNTLLDEIKEFWNHLIKNGTNDINQCLTSDKGKVKFQATTGILEYCNWSSRTRIPSKTFEPTEVETDQQGIQVRFYMHHRNTDFPNCPDGYGEIRKWETENGAFRKNWRSVLCYKKIETKTVPIWSKCVKDFWSNWQDGIEFSLKYREGKINKNGVCISSNQEWELRQRVGTDRDARTRDLPISEYSY